jgi:hypothetical protein
MEITSSMIAGHVDGTAILGNSLKVQSVFVIHSTYIL